mgnify:CR=1 FL=1|tara:strand:- start:452 stop:625 length:174 start_codon:yes stop_codon:yes gene_type:complete
MPKKNKSKRFKKDVQYIHPHPLEQIEEMEVVEIKETKRSRKNRPELNYKPLNKVINR